MREPILYCLSIMHDTSSINRVSVVDAAYTYPFWNWVGGPWSLVKYGVQAVDKRSKTIGPNRVAKSSADPYVTFREAYYRI